MKRKILSLVTALALCLSLSPGTGWAIDGQAAEESSDYTVYIKVPESWGTNVSCYAYIGEGNTDADKNHNWPGVLMDNLSGGYWKYNVPVPLVNSLAEHNPDGPIFLIFNDGNSSSTDRYPADQLPGIKCTSSGDWLFTYDGTEHTWAQHSNTEHLYKGDKCVVCTAPKPIDLDFSSAAGNLGTLETDGYQWDAGKKTLTLKDSAIGTVTLPDDTITISVNGNCNIKTLYVDNPQNTELTISGNGKLTVDKMISISGGKGNILTVNKDACLDAKAGISVCGDGSVNGTITVYGKLTAASTKNGNAIYAGNVIVERTGSLEVSGNNGIVVGGLNPEGGEINYTGAFTVVEDGSFTANCSGKTVSVYAGAGFPEGTRAEDIVNFPDGYLPDSCKLELSSSEDGPSQEVSIGSGRFTISKANRKYSVTVAAGEHGTISGSASPASAKEGTQVSLTGITTTPNEGYSFAGWTSSDVTITSGTFTMPAKNVTITASWKEEGGVGPVDPVDPVDPVGPVDPVFPSYPFDGSPSDSPSYPILSDRSENGSVTVNPRYAGQSSTVTLTVTPDSGYVLDTLTVTDSQGNEIKLTVKADGKYTFTMPGRAVTVEAVFAPLPDGIDKDEPCDGGENCPSRAFADLDTSAWYHEATDYVLRNGLMNGYGNGTFGPNDYLSRAMLAQILFNKEGRPGVNYLMQYSDVAAGMWYTEAIRWATSQGIVSGYGNGMFGPNDHITREQLAVMLWRYAGSPTAAGKELHFTDGDEASGWALEALCWSVENNILNGYGDGRLDPKGLATRAQVAQILMNFVQK